MLCRDLEQDQVLSTRLMALGDPPGLIHLPQELCPQLLALPWCPCHRVLIWGCPMGCALKCTLVKGCSSLRAEEDEQAQSPLGSCDGQHNVPFQHQCYPWPMKCRKAGALHHHLIY